MKFGMPTLVECRDIYGCVDLAKRLSLDFIEINTSFPQYQTEIMDRGELNRFRREGGIFYIVHADEGLNPFDYNRSVSECYFELMRRHIDFALCIGAPVINMHLMKGIYVTLPEKVILLNDVYRDEYLARVDEFISMCEREIGNEGLKIAIENVDANPFTSAQRAAMPRFMASSVFALTLDTGHDECLGGKDRDVFAAYPDRLVHLHLHDSDGRSAHLPFGEGRINIKEKLGLLKNDGTCLIEVKTARGLEESIEYLRRIGYEL
ncbi:MAG: sugar phosphate isomerase/epimerase [Clostridia bacterium]|nr:sugar phosphate isomerase/epimerase [Clostridia bacterium]